MTEIEVIRNIAKLRDILKGNDRSISRAKAVSMLAMSDFPDKAKELRHLLENPRESDITRHVAAINLGKIDTPEAREILINNSETQNEKLLAEIILAMSRYGDERSIKAISKVKESATGALKSRAAFVAALISHRMGLEGNDLAPPGEKGFLNVPDDSQRIIVEKATASELITCFRSIGEKPFGIELSQKPAVQLNHGKNSIILLNRNFTSFNYVASLLERKSIPGIVAEKNPEDGGYFVSFLILTSPTNQNNEINIWFARSYGKILFGGKAKVDDRELSFTIRSIKQEGVYPIMVEGEITENSFTLKTAKFSSRVPITIRPKKEEI